MQMRASRARPLESPWPGRPRSPFSIPSWLVSLFLHVVVLLLLAFSVPHGPAGQSEIAGQQVGIVLKHESPQGEVYEGQAAEQPENPSQAAPELASELQSAPVDLSQVLPEQDLQVIGPGLGDAVPEVDAQAGGRNLPSSSAAATRSGVPFFGIEDRGQRIVYVVDHSTSMGYQYNRLGEAKVELLSSVEVLKPMQQFQIVFYNERVSVGPKVDQTGRLPFADDVAKAMAGRFVRGVVADGSTDHKQALQYALRLGPDVIFFLTDADEPRLRPSELQQITRENGGRAHIHAIEFGIGPDLSDDNFLKELARRNGGSYRYVDVSKFKR
jgi:hypothetical protein